MFTLQSFPFIYFVYHTTKKISRIPIKATLYINWIFTLLDHRQNDLKSYFNFHELIYILSILASVKFKIFALFHTPETEDGKSWRKILPVILKFKFWAVNGMCVSVLHTQCDCITSAFSFSLNIRCLYSLGWSTGTKWWREVPSNINI